MSSTTSRIQIIIEGATEGLTAAAARARSSVEGLRSVVRDFTGDSNRFAAAQKAAQDAVAKTSKAMEDARAAGERASAASAQAEATLSRARDNAADAVGRVQTAEAALADLRARGNASDSQIAAAEERLATARRASARASADVEAAERRLATAQREVIRTAGQSAEAIARHRQALKDLEDANRRAESGYARLVGAFAKFRQALGAVGKVLGPVVAGLRAMLTPLLALGAAGGAVKLIAGATAALQQLLPIVLLLPGALLAAGVAFATLKIGLSGVGDAFKSGAAGAKAFAQLAPSAQAFVTATKGLAGAFGDLKKSVQGALFEGFADQVKALGHDYIPIFKAGLTGVAQELNKVGIGFAQAFRSKDVQSDVISLLSNVKSALRGAGTSLGDFAAGFVKLGELGSRYLGGLGEGISILADKFRTFVSAGIENGSIKRFIDGAIQGFQDLARVVGNVGSIIGSVFSGLSAGSGGSSPLATLRNLTGALADFFKTAEAQGPLKALGETMAVVASTIKDVLIAALRAIGPIVVALAPVVQDLARQLGGVLVSAFQQLGPPIADFLTKMGPVFSAIIDAAATVLKTVIIPAIAALITYLNDHIDDIRKFAADTVVAFLGLSSQVLSVLSTILHGLATLFAVIAAAPGPWSATFKKMAEATNGSARSVDGLRGTVDLMHDKAITAAANVLGTQQVKDLNAAINALHDRTITISTNVVGGINRILGFADGGRVPLGVPFLVGERGPELLTLDGRGGVVSTNGQLRQTLGSERGAAPAAVGDSAATPTYVTIPIHIGDEVVRVVRTEINASARNTRRTVTAGSGATF